MADDDEGVSEVVDRHRASSSIRESGDPGVGPVTGLSWGLCWK